MKKLSMIDNSLNKSKIKLIQDYSLQGPSLDVGSGAGLYLDIMHDACKNVVTACDIIDRRLQKKYDFFSFDANNLDCYCKMADYANIYAFDLIEHLNSDEFFLQKVHSKCKRLFISIPLKNHESLQSSYICYLHYQDKTHVREYSISDIYDLADKTRYKVVHVNPQYCDGALIVVKNIFKSKLLRNTLGQALVKLLFVLRKFGLVYQDIYSDLYCVLEPLK